MQHFRSRLARLALTAGLALSASPVLAALLEPPSAVLHRRYHMLAAGEVRGFADDRLQLAGVERLAGADDVPATLALRGPAWLATALEPGQRVIVAYTAYKRDPRLGDSKVVDERGPLLVAAPGLEPAVFADTPEARAVLLDTKDGDAQRERAIAGLASADPQWQNYHAHEVALRPAWHARLDRADRAAVAALVADPDAQPAARAMLLRVAAGTGAPLGRDWWADAALAILASAPTAAPARADDATADLVRTAFEAAEAADRPVPRDSLARWVASDHAALAERALLAARRSAPDTETALAEAALARSFVSSEMRMFLRDHLRRLALMRDAERTAARGR